VVAIDPASAHRRLHPGDLQQVGVGEQPSREIGQIGDRVGGLTSAELFGNHVGGHRAHHWSPVLMQ